MSLSLRSPKALRYLLQGRILFSYVLFVLLVSNVFAQESSNTIRAPIQKNLTRLLQQEDTNRDKMITVQDHGPKQFEIISATGNKYLVEGTSYLANLLQELALAKGAGQDTATLKVDRIYEPPASHPSRMIREYYWDWLTRSLDAEGLEKIFYDPKIKSQARLRVYVPYNDTLALRYYRDIAEEKQSLNLEVIRLPENITPEYVKSINGKPGILSLALTSENNGTIKNVPFVVPGGRFNEMYGWDSYFILLGLVADGRIELAKAIMDNFIYEIEHYGKILNANRTYYLTRSQPPFLTSMALAVYDRLPQNPKSKEWLARAFRAAIYEYETVWTGGKRLTETGLSRYYGYGIGIPPEVDVSEYKEVLEPYARKRGLTISEFARRYQSGEVEAPELDRFFKHDRSMRESGHDSTYRLIGRTADLNPVSLNSLLYKYEMDIGRTIKFVFDNKLVMHDKSIRSSDIWFERAQKRKRLMNKLLWNEEEDLFFDYNFVENRQLPYLNATTLYPLWAGLATPEQANRLVSAALSKLETPGGIVASNEHSRGPISPTRPGQQWDYPYGWAPHQMLAWQGLLNYGFKADARRLAYKWVHMIAFNAKQHSGAVTEKYDVVSRSLNISVAYGNVGLKFNYVPDGGFGWTNASFQVGLALLTPSQRQTLERLVPPEWIFSSTSDSTKDSEHTKTFEQQE
ncbi:MAG TPA: trehalase family glycosidase [Thermodesulfobacteriota bacterium]|nr:trehalase family glycosidase [Thermodesulfobacteriota bacterium]